MGLNLAENTISFFIFSLLELLFLAGSILYFKIKKMDVKEEFKTRLFPQKRTSRERIADILMGIGIGIAFFIIGSFILDAITNVILYVLGEDFYQSAAEGSVNVTPPILSIFDLIISILIGFFLIAFCEEFAFRGVIYKEFGELPKKKGLVISGLIFAIYHVFPGIVPIQTTVTYFPYYFFMGILFVYLTYFRKNDLLSAIIAHATFNSIILILDFL
ncbi:MAG: CPBP family intramembrane metalloprotease [archaeon]|nr:CPBP family intramembrane metalloprotease [archaeon]